MKTHWPLSLLVALAAAGSVNAADAKENWEKHCAKCHGADGKGDTKMGKKLSVKDYTDAKVQADMKDEKMFTQVKEGLKDGDKVRMKPFNEVLNDAEIKELVAHVRAFKK